MNPQMVQWIRRTLSEGHTPQQAYQYLVKEGYAPGEVNAAIRFASAPAQAPSPKARSPKKPVPLIVFILAGMSILSLIIGIITFFATR